ncbi:MAG: YtxH domain-containing protein [Magnetococcales bacterium]|nr:YtxH domain-containing protein [Magnetococcales bacterium]
MYGYHHGHAPYPYGMPQPPHEQHHAETPSGGRLIKGALIGAAAAYLLTNESVQRSTIRSLVKVWNLARGGVEELKERFQDAHAELQADRE